jgi:hypothetical protein
MKLMKQLFPVFLMMFLLASCTEDDGPGTGIFLPTSDITTLTPTVIQANGSFQVSLSADDGDSPLNTLTITKDGSNVSLSNIKYNGSPAAANPRLLLGADKTSFTYTIDVQTNLAADESATYAFVIAAENGDETTEVVVITAEAAMDPPILVISGTITESNNLLQVPLTATLGSDSLSTIAVYENGVLAAANRLTLGAMTVWNMNPYTLPSTFKDGFSETLLISLPTTNGTYSYLIIVSDPSGLTDSAAFDAEVDLGTPVDSIKTMLVLANSAGPSGTGGVNLITGAQTGSGAAGAHLRDLGIDSGPVATNWLQQIGAGNATETLKLANAADYDGTTTKEEIESYFDNGTAVTADKLVGGEIFALKTLTGVYVLVRVDAVNVTTNNNADFYSLSAKF